MTRAALLLALTLGACTGGGAGNNATTDEVVTTGPESRTDATEVVTVRTDSEAEDASATPMADREAVLGILNKRNGVTREFKLKPGQAARIDNVIVHLRACEKTAPWEQDELTGAFVQVDVEQFDKKWVRVFSGWLFKERPALNVVQHGIYDVWPKSCAMTFKESGADTVAAPSGSGGRSSEKKSPSTTGEPAARPATDSPSAAPSNAT